MTDGITQTTTEPRGGIKIVVTTFVAATGAQESTKEMFYGRGAQSWLAKHTMWCVNNGRVLEISKVGDIPNDRA